MERLYQMQCNKSEYWKTLIKKKEVPHIIFDICLFISYSLTASDFKLLRLFLASF